MISFTIEGSAYSKDICKCSRCGGLLSRASFVTDSIGRVLEKCPHCLAGAPEMKPYVPNPNEPLDLGRECIECGKYFRPEKRRMTALLCSGKCRKARHDRALKEWWANHRRSA